MKCDLKITIGSVVPHPNTGFGDGGKSILPGVASMETIEHFHRQENKFKQRYPDKQVTGVGVFDDNPLPAIEAKSPAPPTDISMPADKITKAWCFVHHMPMLCTQPYYFLKGKKRAGKYLLVAVFCRFGVPCLKNKKLAVCTVELLVDSQYSIW